MEQAVPKSPEAEVAVLGGMLLDENAINDAIEWLTESDFFLESHQRIFRSIAELNETGNTADWITVLEDLRSRKWLDAVGGQTYLSFLTEGIPRNIAVAPYCKIIRDKAVLRSVMAMCDASIARAADQAESPGVILEALEEGIMQLSQGDRDRGFATMLDALKNAGGLDAYVDVACNPVAMTGLAMGFRDIDEMTGGMKPGDMIVIAGRPGSGKSSMAINIAVNVVRHDPGAVVAVFSLEMTKEALQKRMLCSIAEVSARRMQQGFIGKDERSRIAGAARWLAEMHIHIDDSSSITPVQMRAKARRLKQRMDRLDLVVVDYLQLMSPGQKYGSREQEVASVSRGTKAMAKYLGVPVIALAQLNREGETYGNKRPTLKTLRESGQIESDADHVGFIHREEIYDPENDDVKGLAEYILAKQREGPTGVRRLAYIADLTKFTDLEIKRGGSDVHYREEAEY